MREARLRALLLLEQFAAVCLKFRDLLGLQLAAFAVCFSILLNVVLNLGAELGEFLALACQLALKATDLSQHLGRVSNDSKHGLHSAALCLRERVKNLFKLRIVFLVHSCG